MKKFLPKILLLTFITLGFYFFQGNLSSEQFKEQTPQRNCLTQESFFVKIGLIDKAQAATTAAGGCSNITVTAPSTQQFAEFIVSNSGIINAWKVLIALANSAFVIFVIFVAFANILRFNIDTYAIKKTLPSLIMGVLLANLSLVLCRVLLEASAVLSNWILVAWSPGGAASNSNLLFELYKVMGIGDATGKTIAQLFSGTGGAAAGVASGGIILALAFSFPGLGCAFLAFIVVILLAPIIFFWALIALFYIRYFVVIVLVIVSPLACFAVGFPMTEKYFQTWWNQFVKWVFMPVVTFFIIKIGIIVSQALDNGNTDSGLVLMRYIIVLVSCWYAAKIPLTMGGGIMGSWAGLLKKGTGVAATWGAKGYGTLWGKAADKFKNTLKYKEPTIRFRGKTYGGKERSLGDFFRRTNLYGAKKAWQMRQDQDEANRWKAAKQGQVQRTLMGRQARQKADMEDMRPVFTDEYSTDKLEAAANSLTEPQREALWKAKFSDIWKTPELKSADTSDVATAYFAIRQLRRIATTGRTPFANDAKDKFNNLFSAGSGIKLPMAAFAAGTGGEIDYSRMASELASAVGESEENVIKSILGENVSPQAIENVMTNLENGADASQIRVGDKSLSPEQAKSLNDIAARRVERKSQTTSDSASEGSDNEEIRAIFGGDINTNAILDEIGSGTTAEVIRQKYGKDITPHLQNLQSIANRRKIRQDKILSDYSSHVFNSQMQTPAEEALTVAKDIKMKVGKLDESSIDNIQRQLQEHLGTLDIKTSPEVDAERFNDVKNKISQISPTLAIAGTDSDSLKKNIESVVKGLETMKGDNIYKMFEGNKSLTPQDMGKIRQLQKENFQNQYKQNFAANQMGEKTAQHISSTSGDYSNLDQAISPQVERMLDTFKEITTKISQNAVSISGLKQDIVKSVSKQVAGQIKTQAGTHAGSSDELKKLFTNPTFKKQLGKFIGTAANNALGQKLNTIQRNTAPTPGNNSEPINTEPSQENSQSSQEQQEQAPNQTPSSEPHQTNQE